MGTQLPPPKKGAEPPFLPNFRPMSTVAKQLDGSRWHLAWRWPWSRPHCARWGPSSPFQKGGADLTNFGPFLLWPNGYMHQDATWYGGRPEPGRLCVRLGPSSLPKNGRSPQFSAHVCCGQTAAWIEMPLGMAQATLHVLDGDTAPPLPKKGWSPPIFGPRLL